MTCCPDVHVGRTYVLGNDSDFFLFKNCRYVNFADIVFVRHPQTKDKSGQQVVQVVVNVYTRAALSKVLAVSEEFLVDLGIYLGNDYTGIIAPQCELASAAYLLNLDRIGPFARSGFKFIDGDSKEVTLPFIAETADALAAILENVKQGAIFSDNKDQQVSHRSAFLSHDMLGCELM